MRLLVMATRPTRTARTCDQLWWLNCVVTVVLLHVICQVTSHPQCLDSNPPFESSSPLTLCKEYHSSGCCSAQQEEELKDLFLAVKHRLFPADWDRCKEDVRKLLCARCSPWSAHTFDGESPAAKQRQLPGMCPTFCQRFYGSCRDVVWFLDPDLAASEAFQSETAFCEKMKISDMNYCFTGELGDHGPHTGGYNVASQVGCVCLEQIAKGLANPILAVHAGDDSGRLYVGEQRGVVYVMDPVSKERSPTPFLDISDRLILVPHYDERGMGGVAFHPNFSSNGRLFVYYNRPLRAGEELEQDEKRLKSGWDHVSTLSEMHVRPDQPGSVDPSSEKVLLEMHHPFANHNGGALFFLDDGYLYLALGDGGSAGDPFNLAQNKSWLLGKILRLDVDTPSEDPDRPYSIPPDNPFVDSPEPSARPEIFAYGVRNMWRCGVDMGDRTTGKDRGRVLCGDVGQGHYEEVDLLRKGANYGWRAREGYQCYNPSQCNHIGQEDLPVYVYDHSVGQSVTGGQFYRGACFPALNGLYIYGDYMSRRFFSLHQANDASWQNNDVTLCASDLCTGQLTNEVEHYILSFGQDQRGEVYVLTSNSSLSSTEDGALYRIVDPQSGVASDGCRTGK